MRPAVFLLAAVLVAAACSTVDGPERGAFSAQVNPQDEASTASTTESDTDDSDRDASDGSDADGRL